MINKGNVDWIEAWVNILTIRFCNNPSHFLAQAISHYCELLATEYASDLPPIEQKAWCRARVYWLWRSEKLS